MCIEGCVLSAVVFGEGGCVAVQCGHCVRALSVVTSDRGPREPPADTFRPGDQKYKITNAENLKGQRVKQRRGETPRWRRAGPSPGPGPRSLTQCLALGCWWLRYRQSVSQSVRASRPAEGNRSKTFLHRQICRLISTPFFLRHGPRVYTDLGKLPA